MYGYYQQRLAQMEAQYPQFAMPQTIRASLVMNKEEANAQQVAMDGSISMFLNNTANEIYTKKLGNNGLPEFKTYILVETPVQKDSYTELKEEITKLKQEIKELKDVKQSDDSDVPDDKPTKK